jgi:DNA-binding winged helix-turn-helix (wHTH) protein/tetratricopeptide (TPR) repeat protein
VTYAFGEFELDEQCFELRWRGTPVKIEPKVLSVLVYLVRHRNRVVTKEELLRKLWPLESVTDSSLGYSISKVRQALDHGPPGKQGIRTFHRRGYRFMPPVTLASAARSDASAGPGLPPPTSPATVPAGSVSNVRPLPDAAASPREAPGTVAPFIGRERDLARLSALVQGVLAGRGATALVFGDAGIGKTRLVSELATHATLQGLSVFTGACHEAGGAAAYGPVAEALGALADSIPELDLEAVLGDQAAWLVRLVPELRGYLYHVEAPPTLPMERERDLVLAAAATFVRRVAREQPLVLVVEDLHWADASTVLLLRSLARTVTSSRILIVGTFREEEIDPAHPLAAALPELHRQGALFLPLAGLDQESVGRLLAALAQDDLPQAIVAGIWRQTEGNPLFVQEFVRLLLEERRLLDPSDRWPADLDLGALAVPQGVRLVIGRRLARLSRTTRQVLSTAAVMGRHFRYDILEDATDLPPDALLDAIDEAERTQILTSRTDGQYVTCSFHHELVSHCLYGELSLPRRQRLHRRVAEVMELAYSHDRDGHAAELAYHFSKAGSTVDRLKRIRYLALAGDRAMAASAFEEAVRYFQAGVAIAAGESAEQAELLLRLGSAQLRDGASDEAVENLQYAATIHERLGNREGVEEACLALTWLQGWRGKFPELHASMHQGLRAAPDSTSEARCRLLAIAGKWLTFGGQPTAAEHAIDNALAIAAERKDGGLRGTVLATRGGNQWVYTAFSRAERTLREAALLLRRAGDLAALPLCRTDYIITLGYLGLLDEMEEPLTELHALAERLGDPGCVAIHDLFRIILAFTRGDLAAAADWSERAEVSARHGAALVLPPVLQLRGQIAFLGGDCERAEADLGEAARLNAEMGCPPVRYIGFLSQAYVRAFRGDRDGARALLADAPAPPAPGTPVSCLTFDGMATAAQVYVLLDLPAKAAALYQSLCAAASRGAVFCSSSYPLLQRVLGMIAAANRWNRRADRHYTEALGRAETLQARLEVAHTAYWYARMLLRDRGASRQGRGRALAARALRLYGDMGMPCHLEAARALVPASLDDPPPPRPAPRPRTETTRRASDASVTGSDHRRRPRRHDDRKGTPEARHRHHAPRGRRSPRRQGRG